MALRFPQAVMLARAGAAVPGPRALRGGCVYELKVDGYRAVLFVTDDHHRPGRLRAQIQSRRGSDLTDYFPDIADAAVRQLPPGVVLDGELVVYSGGRLDFSALQRRARTARHHAAEAAAREPATFMAFDLLALDDIDVRPEPLATRRRLLEELFGDVSPPLQLVPQTDDRDVAVGWMEDYQRAGGLGIEGLVVKGKADPYLPDKRGWVKVKTRETADALIGAVVGTLEAPRRLVLAVRDEAGRLRVAGTTGDLKASQRAEVAAAVSPAGPGHPWPTRMSLGWGQSRRELDLVLVEPDVTVEVLADTGLDGHRWRHTTRYVRLRHDA